MKKRSPLLYVILALPLLLTACGGGDDGPAAGVVSNPCAGGAGSYFDDPGDVPSSIIDMTDLKVTLTDTDITAEMVLLSAPDPIDIDDPGTPDNAKEYGWEVTFDMSGDGDCYSAGDVGLGVLYFKSSSTPQNRPLFSVATKDLFVLDSDGKPVSLGPANATLKGNTLTLSVLRTADIILPSINTITPIRFETTQISGGTTFKDHHPD